ncbi:MAG: TRAP transporter substrate-binding protein DctP, partial [Synergistaceae bacterium]|nr:TRAP transporter substrate-binding protein DctP [Synergistaceae bacterium]MBQ3449370.1 TRAP transporter substrate-binding protein DctP [Synergistaceae bacterium]
FMQNKEIKTPADLKGVVTRTPSAAPYNASIKAMGATPYNIAWSEVYNAIQTKMIDACEVQYTSAVSTHIYEVCKYVAKTEHINLFNCLVCGEAWFSKLPDEYKKIILEACYNNGIKNAREIEAAQADLEKVLIDNGMTITHVDKDEFRKAAASAYEELGWTGLRKAIYEEAGL